MSMIVDRGAESERQRSREIIAGYIERVAKTLACPLVNNNGVRKGGEQSAAYSDPGPDRGRL